MHLVFSKISSSQVSKKFALPMKAAAECNASKELSLHLTLISFPIMISRLLLVTLVLLRILSKPRMFFLFKGSLICSISNSTESEGFSVCENWIFLR